MIFQEELVSYALSSTGQVFLEPYMLRFDGERLRRDFLEPCIGEYQAFRPPMIWEHLYLDSNGWLIPDRVRRINSLRPLWLYYWPYAAAIALRPVPRMEAAKWFTTEGILYAPPGRYELQYISNEGYTITNESGRHTLVRPYPNQTNVKVRLRTMIERGTLTIYAPDGEEAADNGNGLIEGSFLDSGIIDYETSEVDLTLNTTYSDPIEVSFYSVNPGVKELDWSEIYFRDMFSAKFLSAFATTRSLLQLENLPVNINVDDLLTFARQKEADWLLSKETKASWWRW